MAERIIGQCDQLRSIAQCALILEFSRLLTVIINLCEKETSGSLAVLTKENSSAWENQGYSALLATSYLMKSIFCCAKGGVLIYSVLRNSDFTVIDGRTPVKVVKLLFYLSFEAQGRYRRKTAEEVWQFKRKDTCLLLVVLQVKRVRMYWLKWES